jgi:hypothetical protein
MKVIVIDKLSNRIVYEYKFKTTKQTGGFLKGLLKFLNIEEFEAHICFI